MQISIESLSKTFPGGITALDDVSLTIGVGMFGLLGPNGAGKTTLMRILCTLLEPTAGRIMFGAVDRLKEPQRIREMIGYLPQEFGFYKRLTGPEYLDFAGGMKGISGRERRAQIPKLLELVNLSSDAGKRLGQYSGGMKRRLGIAQALLGDPGVLVVDEPTAGLDPEERLRFRNLLAEISAERIVLLSTHIVADVESVCTQVAVMDRGQIKFTGSPSGLVRQAERRVWQMAVDAAEFNRLQQSLRIIAFRRESDSVMIRVLAKENPLGRGTPADATLEDGYLCLMDAAGSRPGREVPV